MGVKSGISPARMMAGGRGDIAEERVTCFKKCSAKGTEK